MLKHSTGKAFKAIFTLISVLVLGFGQAVASGGSDGEFNAGDMIMHHVMDAHDIHLMTIGEHQISIPLPIIMWSNEDGLSIFSSSRFHHGQAAYNRYALDHGHVIRLGSNNPLAASEHLDIADAKGMGYSEESWKGFFNGRPAGFINMSITKTAAGVLITVLLMFIIFLNIARAYGRNPNEAPKGLQSLLEPIILFVRDEIAKPSIGHRYETFLPFLLTVFFFIWIANILGLIPFIGGFNVTGNIAVTLVLAVFTFIMTTVKGNRNYWAHIFATPGVPGWLLPLMVPIEIMGMLTKPVVLCLRLFANITAGHIIILSFMSLIFIFAAKYGAVAGYGVSIVSLLFGIFMNTLEILVAFLQAYVFTLLSALYLGAAVEEHHH
ncbi:MAG: F0F1 ATP synthase subunit A [Flavobacteriales bacterium]|nr:F0F1 ATP synthase subunit A [Flavobacteriales bacterium]